ncbi:hypothetical protein DFP72DRAFT_575050 [Ephemerocybe angulata]|uniref:Uncharacterized protein n=1 Tax=Ephemerocybe angulata TaxID=980116 RepID=A0A8H6HL25_9AGAR|nr:hypothetical protein DFP72DRAFT_575050 [Tulosesus angulatus]
MYPTDSFRRYLFLLLLSSKCSGLALHTFLVHAIFTLLTRCISPFLSLFICRTFRLKKCIFRLVVPNILSFFLPSRCSLSSTYPNAHFTHRQQSYNIKSKRFQTPFYQS